MGSNQPHEMNELHQTNQKSSHEERLDLFFQIQKRDLDRKNANRMYDIGESGHAPNHEYMISSEGGPLKGGSAMEAQVAARLASSSLYRTSKPIMRYASKRNNADLLAFDVVKSDYDWLIAPPATPPFNNSIDYSNDGTLENSSLSGQLHALATVQEVDVKNFVRRPEPSVIPNSRQLDNTSLSNSVAAANLDRPSLSWESHENSHTKLGISSNPSDNATTDVNVNRSHTISNKKPLSNSEMKASTRTNGRNSSINPTAKGYSIQANSQPTSKGSLKITNPTSRFSELPSIITNANKTSHTYKSSAVGSSSASTTPRADMTSNAKRSTDINAPSRRPTTPRLSPNESKAILTNNGGKTRSTSIGRGAINISSNTGANRSTNKVGKGSRSTSSSRAGSPETARILPWEPSEMPGFSTEAPPNLRTTVSTRSTSTTRSTRSTSTSRSSMQPTTPTNHNNDNSMSRNTSRSTSASKVRSTSTSKSSDRKTNTDGINAISSKTSRASNKNGAVNNNVLGSSMVDKVIQARRAAASTSKSPLSLPLSTASLPLQGASSSLSSLSLTSTPSLSSLSISSTSSLSSLPSTLSASSSSFSSPPASSTLPSSLNTRAMAHESRNVHLESNSRLRQNKVVVKSASNTAAISTNLFRDTNSGFNSSRLNQSSKPRPMPRNGEAHQSEMIMPHISEPQAKPLRNILQVKDIMNGARHRNVGTSQLEDTMNHIGQSNVESRNLDKTPKEVEQQLQKQQQQYQMSKELSDFSNELNEIMRQGVAHHQYGALPSKDTIKVSNNVGNSESRITSTTRAKEVEQKHQNPQRQCQISEESSDFSNELNAIMRQDKAHYHAFPSKDIIKVSNNWMLNSPDCSMKDDSVDLMHLFRQGIDRYGISESPLVCQHGAPGNCDKCNNVHGKGFKSTAEVWRASPLLNSSRFSHKQSTDLWKGSPF